MPRAQPLLCIREPFLHDVCSQCLYEAADPIRVASSCSEFPKECKTGQREQHVDEFGNRFWSFSTAIDHTADKNRQQTSPPLVARAKALLKFRIGRAGSLQAP